MIRYEYYSNPKDFIFQYQKASPPLQTGCAARGQAVSEAREFTIVAVGKPSDFGKPLTELGLPVSNIDLRFPSAEQERAKEDPASLERGRKLLEAGAAIQGGADKLAAVKDCTMVAERRVLRAGGAKMKGQADHRWLAPSHIRPGERTPVRQEWPYISTAAPAGWCRRRAACRWEARC
jgi:hypothetical protein